MQIACVVLTPCSGRLYLGYYIGVNAVISSSDDAPVAAYTWTNVMLTGFAFTLSVMTLSLTGLYPRTALSSKFPENTGIFAHFVCIAGLANVNDEELASLAKGMAKLHEDLRKYRGLFLHCFVNY